MAIMSGTRRALVIVGLGLVPVLGLALLRSAFAAPPLMINPSPSEPRGLYRLAGGAAGPGALIAFHVPRPGQAYAWAHIRYVMRNAILKQVAAGAGSTVCERNDRVYIDGVGRAIVATRDRNGVPLPHWEGCRRLEAGEYFALSTRIPNSFDSRYYGPVQAGDVVGVYEPLWTE